MAYKDKLCKAIMENVANEFDILFEVNEDFEEKPIDYYWDLLIDNGIATPNELKLVTDIIGYNIESLEKVLYARTGYHNISVLLDDEDEDHKVLEAKKIRRKKKKKSKAKSTSSSKHSSFVMPAIFMGPPAGFPHHGPMGPGPMPNLPAGPGNFCGPMGGQPCC